MQDRQLEHIIRLIVEELQRSLKPEGDSIVPQSPPLPASQSVNGGDVLCLFYEPPTGLEKVGQQLTLLQERGILLGCWQPEILLPASFQSIHWNDVLTGRKPQELREVVKGYPSILVANLSRRATAELATGATALIQGELIYQALGNRSRVLAVTDPLLPARVSCPHDPVQLSAVQSRLEEQKEALKDLGIDLILSEEVFDRLVHQVEHQSQTVDALSGFITLEDVEGFEGREIRLIRGARLTPLALDWLRDHQIDVRYVDP